MSIFRTTLALVLVFMLQYAVAFRSPIYAPLFRTTLVNLPCAGGAALQSNHFVGALVMKGQQSDDDEQARARSDRIYGTGTDGKTLLILALLLNVWFFTVPPEFRRTRLCSEAETEQFPEVCMTAGQFRSKVADYYANGGGIKWDFSIAPETKEYFNR